MSGQILTSTDHTKAGAVTTITLSNPGKINIIGRALMAALTDAIQSAAATPDLRAIILRGEGTRAFIGGADIREMATLDPPAARAFITGLHNICAAIRACPVPVVARLQGYTLGAGLEIAAACDIRLASDTAMFGMPEVKVGIPSVIEAALLPQLIGWGRTRRLLYTGEMFTAAQALSWGFVEETVPDPELDSALARLIADITACGPRAIRAQKRLIAQWERLPLTDAIDAGIDCFESSFTTDEPARMMGEFLSRKRP